MLYRGVHRNLLYHWIGRHIDFPDGTQARRGTTSARRLTDDLRCEYLDCLRCALDPARGIWVKPPEKPDFLLDGEFIRSTKPIACFTEWPLAESAPHTTRYGRLGLGLAKRFVIQCGGQPVTYVRNRMAGDVFTKGIVALAAHLRVIDDPDLTDALSYLSHFVKPLRRRRPVSGLRKICPAKGAPKEAKRTSPNLFHRSFGTILQYLEEREWRIVYNSVLRKRLTLNNAAPVPDYYLRVVPGRDLHAVALPDNRTVHMAIHDSQLRGQLFPKDLPHVALVSLEDMGTF